MTKEQWINFCTDLQPADILFSEAQGFGIGALIQFGTSDGDELNPCHAFQYVGDGVGKTIEADGKAINFHTISEYEDRVLKGKERLVVFRVPSLTITDLECIKKRWKEQLGLKYNWWSITCFAIWGIFNRFTPFGRLLTNIKNPAYDKKSLVCSQQTCDSFFYIPFLYNELIKDKPINNMTPEELSERIIRIALCVADTKKIK